MLDIFIFKLILTAIAFLPHQDGSYRIQHIPSPEVSKASTLVISRKSGPDEHDGIHYLVTEQDSGQSFRIEFIDNGLYRIILDAETVFELDMIEYYMDLDNESKKKTELLLGKDGDRPISVRLVNKQRFIKAREGDSQTLIVPEH